MKQANILVDSIGVARVADFGLMTMTDLSTLVLSETVVFSGGTLSWMSPELLDPPRFSSDGCPTRESDCYALGLVVYEVNFALVVTIVSCSSTSGSHRSPTVQSHNCLHTCARYTKRRTSKETARRHVPGILR